MPQKPETTFSTSGKRFGGVTLSRVKTDDGMCPCGKLRTVCDVEWDDILNLLEPTTENYKANLKKLNRMTAEDDDPYH